MYIYMYMHYVYVYTAVYIYIYIKGATPPAADPWSRGPERAEDLPVDGIPPEIIALLGHDDNLANVQRQKAATPVHNMLTPDEVRDEFAYMCKPNAVVGERTSAGLADINAQQLAALHAVASQSQPSMEETTLTIHTGNRLLDQFESWYFALAFAFLFPSGSAMPDPPTWSAKARHRRPEDASRVELSAWMRCMARRCEAQLNRDSCLPRAVPKRTRTTHSTTRARFVRLPSAALCVLAK